MSATWEPGLSLDNGRAALLDLTDDFRQRIDQLTWVIRNSEGVRGLRADGEVMPWEEVLRLYAPSWGSPAQGGDR